MVVADERHAVVRIRADDADRLDFRFIKRQNAVVFQQHNASARGFLAKRQMLRALHDLIGNGVVFAVFVKLAEHKTRGKEPLRRRRDVVLGDEPVLERAQQMQICVAAVYVTAHLNGERSGFRRGGRDVVVQVKIGNRPAVGDKVSLKAPLAAQNFADEQVTAAARLAERAVVCAHHGLHFALFHSSFKRGQIRLPQILPAHLGVKFVANGLRAAVHSIVLRARRDLQIFPVTLQALDVRHAEPRREVRVFAVRLLPSAPARVTEQVDIRRPEREALINIAVAVLRSFVILRAGLRRNDIADFSDHLRVKHARHSNGLRKHRRRAGARHAVQRFVPPVVRRNAQPFNGRRIKFQL